MRIHVPRIHSVASGKFWITIAFAVMAFCWLPTTLVAQSDDSEIIPNRGFHPSASYALGHIETINTTNGNLMLDIPLASLPAGRGGHPGFTLRLVYNSKIWDGQPDVAQNPSNPNQTMAVTWLVDSDQGGWGYNLRPYGWSMYNRNSGGVYYPPPDCRNTNIWMMKMRFPDGSQRQFRPYGYDDQCNDGYFTVQPAPGRSYYSIDGTFTRLDFGASTSEWTLYFADGTRVVNSTTQRTYDRNGNYTEIQGVSNYNNTGHAANIVTDQLGRSIVVEKGVGEDYVHVDGVNGEIITTTVKWGSTYVKKTYRAGNHYQYDVYINNWPVPGVKEIILPSQLGTNLKYTFGYNGWPTSGNTTPSVGWGELSSVTLPSGATADYQYERDNQSGTGIQANWILKNSPTRKDLNYDLEYDGSTIPAPTETWLYSMSDGSAQITAPDGGITKEWFTDIDFSGGGLVYKMERPDGSIVERIWKENRPYLPPGVTIHSSVKVNNYISKEFVSIRDAGGTLVKTATKDYRHDKNGNLVQQFEYDWVPYTSVSRDAFGKPTDNIPAGAQLKRVNTVSYYAATPDASDTTTNDPDSYDKTSAPQILKAIKSGETGNGSQTLSRNEFFYDNSLTTGNLTQQKSWDSTKGGYSNPLTSGNSISVSHQYDSYGNRTLSTDARGTQTKFIYGSVGSFTGLYPTTVIRAFGTTIQRTSSQTYDFSTGLVESAIDVDNNVVNEMDYDALGRPTEARVAANVPSVKSVTRTEYSMAERRVISRSDLNTAYDGKLVSIEHFDQLGRVRLIRRLEDAAIQSATDETAGIKVQTRYLYSGANSYQLVSNPYRAASSGLAGSEQTMGWSRTKSDNGGRLVEVQTFGGPALPAPWGANATTTGTIATSYDADFTTVADQAGKVRRSLTDSLGRLARVDEPDAGNNLGTTSAPVQPTSYSYDALGNLTMVYQDTQTRSFAYDSLSRLSSTLNPENGTINYTYDDNGNLLTRADARGVVSTHAYDALNRTITRSYSDGTPTVNYVYDAAGVANSKGRLTSVSSTVSTHSYSGYDAMGRVLGGIQTIGNKTYLTSYSYDLAGHIKSINYPSGRVVSYSYDTAGRLNNFSGNLGGGVQRNYATGSVYDAGGRLTKEQFGTATPIYNKLFYNSRGQLAEIRESTSYTGPTDTTWDRGAIINHYSNQAGCSGANCNASDNNGNLRRQQIYIPNSDTLTQFYEYDSLNRLQSARENRNGGAITWQQTYTYDRYGNRRIDTSPTQTFGGVNNVAFELETAKNRLYAPGDLALAEASRRMQYDAAGNLKVDTYTGQGQRTYDAENRMKQAWANGQWQTYSYDGDGRRVKRNVNGVETWQVYGIGGELLAEYAANSADTNPQTEYGFRHGELLIRAEAGTSWGSPPTFTNNPLVVGETTIQALHLTELRNAINLLRGHAGLPAASWEEAIASGVSIKAAHLQELRTKLDEALVALSQTPGGYSAGLGIGLPILAVHVQELRNRVASAWNTGAPAQINWLVTDQLGTPRMVIDQTGSLAGVKRHDYLPFGEELSAGGRTLAQGYSGDSIRQKFTSKERDNETGLDYFRARYYLSIAGRFTSVDPVYSLSNAVSPQSWNRYSYGLNNPLSFVDRNGKWPTWIHELIIDQAFPGLSDEERQFIKYGSWYVDYMGTHWGGTLRERNANEHAMMRPTQSYAEAVAGYQNFIDSKNAQAAALPDATIDGVNRSLIAFGEATHPLADNTSPTHRPFQVYYGLNFPNVGDPISSMLFGLWFIEMDAHTAGESRISPQEMSAATEALQENYRKVYPGKYERAVTRRNPMAFLNVGLAYYVPSWQNVLAVVTVYPDGRMEAKGRNLKYHPSKTK